MSNINFKHKLGAHCESGVVTSLLNHAGFDISESMVFGISGAIFFGYLNTPKMPFPTFAVRNQPGKIRDNLTKYLNTKFEKTKFRDPEKATRELDALIDQGIPVAVQVDFFYMDYVPAYVRVHFNGHYIIVVGKNTDNYIISDVYAPHIVELNKKTLQEARFAKGSFQPKGLMFYVNGSPKHYNLEKAIRKGIKHAAFYMLHIPIPFLGIRGIRYFAKKLPEWPRYTRDLDHLSHEIMMISILLEERGTGGAGFRFMYATFLREAAKILKTPGLNDLARRMMENGDEWRKISIISGRMGKNRDLGVEKLKELGSLINKRADVEKQLFSEILKTVK